MNRDNTVLKPLLPLLTQYPGAMTLVVVIGMLASLFEGLGISLFIPVLQTLMQEEPGNQSGGVLTELLLRLTEWIPQADRFWALPSLVLVCIALKNIFGYSNFLITAKLQYGLIHRLRSQGYQQLLSVGLDYLETKDSGELFNTLTHETWRTGEAFAKLIQLITILCTTFIYIILLLLISPVLTLIIFVASFTISFVLQKVTSSVKQIGILAAKSNGNLGVRIKEGLIGIRTIKAFAREDYEQKRFDLASQIVRNAYVDQEKQWQLVPAAYEVLSTVLVMVVLVVALQYNQGSLPAILTFLFLVYRLQPQLQTMEGLRTNLKGFAGSIDNVLSFLDSTDKPYVLTGVRPFAGIKQTIHFEDVSFVYPGQKSQALNHLSLMIPAGKTTALVGPSGAGKSTLIGLICRFYDPSEGLVLVDGEPLHSFRLVDWRRHVSIVSQDVHIFNATIAQNIAYGNPDAPREEIIAAAKQAHADGFISKMPDGYDTHVGDRGLRLSGGQKQRLALARAIVGNPDILILDEATNALDSISEQLIQEALAILSLGRTVIVIAHRLSTIEQADQIVVLEHGRLVEIGTLLELINKKGLFHQMYDLQNSISSG